MNYVDFLIIIVLLFYAIEGLSAGFLLSLLDLGSFVASFLIGLTFYSFFGKILATSFSIPVGFSNALGFFIAAFLSEIVVSLILRTQGLRIKINLNLAMDRFLGASVSILSGLVLMAFIATLIVSLPLSSFLKNSVSASKIASFLTTNTQGLARNLNDVFGGAVNETLTFLTIEPQSSESLNLNFRTTNFNVDSASEKAMFDLVNLERASRGVRKVEPDLKLTDVGRRHCEDMFRRGYFSHNSPEGLMPFDRMTNAGVEFTFAGENLALAPNTELAMKGLMQSKGHRENILQANFGHLGVGATDGGIYGIMFCQEFKD